jgi:V/A-type H+-transporting ATPase subunit A
MTKNEVVYVDRGGTALRGEVLRVQGTRADVQVFEDTRGIRVGDAVRLSGELLSATLGPGLLGRLYDGLQQPLSAIAARHGFLLPDGVDLPPLDLERQWLFTPRANAGTVVRAGHVLGTVREGRIEHCVMVPFDLEDEATVIWIGSGGLRATEPVARLRVRDGNEREVTMLQRWPVRRPIADRLLEQRLVERLPPSEPLVTGMRIVDTLFPIALGGTACIPGPFGAGKTVLQNLLATYADVDVVVVIACGERAGEVVETLTRLPELRDPRSGGSLLDRTVIICNTSAMPVAARESSIYVGVTIGEYYRQMGLDVLVIADSTSRWAQAMRETSGRMEEIPGDEAFPAYLDSAIRAVYERAGVIRSDAQRTGSLIMIGTVSPAGGNFEEPVTQATLGTVKVFLGLSAERAYRRAFPAIDPLQSWSRYVEPLAPWYREHCGPEWADTVSTVRRLLQAGDGVQQMLEVAGEEGVSIDEYWTYHLARLVDEVLLQQNAYDAVDVYTPIARQRELLKLLRAVIDRPRDSDERGQIRERFAAIASAFRELNYSAADSADYLRLEEWILAPRFNEASTS